MFTGQAVLENTAINLETKRFFKAGFDCLEDKQNLHDFSIGSDLHLEKKIGLGYWFVPMIRTDYLVMWGNSIVFLLTAVNQIALLQN